MGMYHSEPCIDYCCARPDQSVYRKYRKQTLPLGYLDHIMALSRGRHDFTKDPGGSQKHALLSVSAAGCGDLE